MVCICQIQVLDILLVRQALPRSNDGGARMVARLRLAIVSVVVAKWFRYLFVFLLLFRLL
jgi:hypothetical protein